MLAIRDLDIPGLRIERFEAGPGEAWCCIGGNRSGMDRLCDFLGGAETRFRAGLFRWPADAGVVSFRRQQEIYEEELRRDDTDFLDRIDPGTPARAFLTDIEAHRELIESFALGDLLDRGYRQLSSGQARKLCLLAHLTRGAPCLMIESPFEGLDQASCRELDRALAEAHLRGVGLLLFVGNTADIPAWCTHLAAFRDGVLAVQGPAAETREAVVQVLRRPTPLFQVRVEELRAERREADNGEAGAALVTLVGGFACYGEVEVFRGLDLTVNRGDHTLITGPNGCGKSTLLQLVTGDHPLCYINDLTVFGRRRGSGESIWDLKRHMGIVSADLHRNHRIAGSTLAIVVSGLFDSIGLYTRPTSEQQTLARRWLQRLELAHRASVPFQRLGYGEQRLVLLARALIKVPRLLILDEPTQGLDEASRTALLDFLEAIAAEDLCTILYVSHRADEFRPFFTQRIAFH